MKTTKNLPGTKGFPAQGFHETISKALSSFFFRQPAGLMMLGDLYEHSVETAERSMI